MYFLSVLDAPGYLSPYYLSPRQGEGEGARKEYHYSLCMRYQ